MRASIDLGKYDRLTPMGRKYDDADLSQPLETDSNIESLIARYKLPPSGQAYVRRVLISPPSRIVQNGAGNYIGRFASRKNGKSLGPESLLEYCYDLQAEHDKRILRFCDQPEPIRLHKSQGIRTPLKAYTTPDNLEIAENGFSLIECKWEKDLLILSKNHPDQYILDDQENWHYIPGEVSATSLGMRYLIFTERNCNPVLLNNLSILRPYFRKNALMVPADVVSAILNYVTTHRLATLGALLALPMCRLSHILRLVATGRLYADLTKQYLLCGRDLLIAPDQATYDQLASSVAETDPATLDFIEGFIKSLEADPNKFVGGSGWQEKEKISRYRLIKPFLDSGTYPPQEERTLRRHFDTYKKYGIEGLKPKLPNGNRTQRMPDGVYPLMQRALKEVYANANQKPFERVYEFLDEICNAAHFSTPAHKTLKRFIRDNEILDDLNARYGERATYNRQPYENEQEALLRRHGSRIFEIAHIDHTEVDVMLLDSETGRLLYKAWLTVMIDAFSRRILAIWVSYDKPSNVACMMVLRECVRRFHRLPDRIIVDNGKEFNGIYFESLLAKYGRDKINRPPHESRVGSVSERFFLTLDNGVHHVLDGNTQALKTPRSMSRSVDPRRRARHTLQDLDLAIKKFAYQVYDKVKHAELQISPRQAFVNSARESGILDLNDIPFDLSFYIATLPSVSGKTRTVYSRYGISVDRYDYWHPLFRAKKLDGKQVEVRYEPMDFRVVFAFINGHWHVCRNYQLTGDVRLTRKCTRYLGRENRKKNRLVSGPDAKHRSRAYRRFHKQVTTGEGASADIQRCRENFKVAQSVIGGINLNPPRIDVTPVRSTPKFNLKNRKRFRISEHETDVV